MSREADLRAMREGKFAQAEAFVRSALAKTNDKPPSDHVVRAVAQKVVKALPNSATPISATVNSATRGRPLKSEFRTADGKFDRKAYQAAMARKRRAAKSA